MLDLNTLTIQTLDYIFENEDRFEEQEFFKKAWDIIRKVSYSDVPDGCITDSMISDFSIQDGYIQIIFADYSYNDVLITAEDIRDWYKENYTRLSGYEDTQMLDFFIEMKGVLGNTDTLYFDFDLILIKYKNTELLKEIILNEDTYCSGCIVATSDKEIYYSTNKNYKVELLSGNDFIDANIYYFNKFDLFVIQVYDDSKGMCSMVENGKVIQDSIGISVKETEKSVKRLMLLDTNLDYYKLH